MSAQRPRPPGIAYGTISLVMVILLGALTITATQTSPPAIAEFAPQAVEQIDEAPPEQSSSAGEGEGGGSGGEGGSTTATSTGTPGGTAPRPTIEQARIRRCIGEPPRQTEDPQSPPCVPFFEGDNGGATSRGVSANEIRIAVPRNVDEAQMRTIEAYFNKRYEFYGRQLRLTATGAFGAGCPAQRAEAVAVHALEIFAATDAGTANSACFYDELARQKTIVSEVSYAFSEPQMAAKHPYQWAYLMGVDKIFAATGDMVCGRLDGGNATHSTDSLLQGTPRRFGAILQTSNRDDELPLAALEAALARCGVSLAATAAYDFADDNGTRGRDAILRMQDADVTTIICLCIIVVEASLAPAATTQGYFPEWILNSYGSNDYDVLLKSSWPDPRQRQAMMGITVQPPQRPLDREPGWAAYKEIDPSIRADHVSSINLITLYRSLLLLASGIQMAGPNLTPDTFAAGLQRTPFPNPPDPGNSGRVGFEGPDHGMTNDAAEMWWSESATGADGSRGGWCYVDGGARRMPGAWPSGSDPFFTGPCQTGFR